MSQLNELLTDQLQDLLHAESQLVGALPKLANAAHNPKLKEAFEKHLTQTENHIERLKQVFELLGEKAEPKPCKAMMGLIAEGQEAIDESEEKEPEGADLALVAAAQRVEHYEIAAYGTVRGLARQIGQKDAAVLLSHTLGEEEAADYLLTEICKPILQDASAQEVETKANPTGGKKSHVKARAS